MGAERRSAETKSAEGMFAEKMFGDSLLETSWAQRTRRGWTTLTSFGMEAVVLGLLLLLPLWKTVGLPASRTVSTPVILGHRSAEPTRSAQPASAQSSTTVARFVAPGHIPPQVVTGPDEVASAPPSEIPGLDGIGDGAGNGPPLAITSGNYPVAVPAAPGLVTRQFRSSTILEGSLIHRVLPTYPYPAKITHVQGVVVLAAIISKDGRIENLQLVSGHPLLAGAAIEAVSQWHYKPYILNGEPIEVETRITVNFTLAGD